MGMELFFEDKGEEKSIFQDSIGAKIRKFRELKNFSQKELGERCGFSPNTAIARISQYENDLKIPKEDVIIDIADALKIDRNALYSLNLSDINLFYHVMFDIEELYGLHPVREGGEVFLKFDPRPYYEKDINIFLSAWYQHYTDSLPKPDHIAEENIENKKGYQKWQGEYPYPLELGIDDWEKENEARLPLGQDMDLECAENFSERSEERFNSRMKPIMEEVRHTYGPIQTQADFLLWIEDAIEDGLHIVKGSPQRYANKPNNVYDMFSIKFSSINKSEERQKAFAAIEYAREILEWAGLQMIRRVTAADTELYFTYYFSEDIHYKWFPNDVVFWREMYSLLKFKSTQTASKEMLGKREEMFQTRVNKTWGMALKPKRRRI